MKKSNVPIFPLKIVALPGSIQSLQIFEPRYVNMVKNSLKEDSGFVIAFFEEENSESSVAISKKGTYVRIIDFNKLFSKIGEKCREIMNLSLDYSYNEISERLDIERATVGSRLSRCYEELRGLGEHG